MIRLDGKAAFITGAARGLGAAYARLFAERGAAVAVVDRDHAGIEAVVDAIRAAGGVAHAIAGDIVAASPAIVAEAVGRTGRIDIVINNAGILRDRSFAKTDFADFDAVLATHLTASARITHAAWPHLVVAGGGRVLMTSSHAGLFGNFGQAAYAAAKLGLVGLTRVLAIEGARHGIVVNAIVPIGATRMFDGTPLAAVADRFAVEDVAAAALWLCAGVCPLRGQTLVAGGGRVALAEIVEAEGVRVEGGLTPEVIAAATDRLIALDGARAFAAAGEAIAAGLERGR